MKKKNDFKKMVAANVRFRGTLAGVLEKLSESHFRFQYNQSGTPQIATSLPLSQTLHDSSKLHPFFDNLIVEGWLLQYAEKILQIDRSNRFALLMATGHYPIGAVSLHPINSSGDEIPLEHLWEPQQEKKLKSYENKPLPNFDRCPSCFTPITSKSSHNTCIKQLWGTLKKITLELDPEDPLGSFSQVIYGGSISGAQRKGMFRLGSKGQLIPTPKEAQYILKPDGNFKELPENEHVTMAIAKKIGFETPPFSMLYVDGRFIFTIKRFDKLDGQSLMLEDMCQIIQSPSSDKYESSCEKVATCIAKFSSAPKIDLTEFYRRLVFCYFIANADMHLKNWSLLENRMLEGHLQLSPCYDLLNTRLPIPGEKIDIGLPLGGKERNLQKTYFQRFGRKLCLNGQAIEQPFSELDDWWAVTEDFVKESLLSPESKEKYLSIVYERYKILS